MDIPDSAIEAAEKAIQVAQEEWHPTTLGPGALARIALEAAAPHIAAQAWGEGYMRGQYPFTTEGQEDPIPPARFPPSWGGNANPYRDPQ